MWQEIDKQNSTTSAQMLDVVFRIECRQLPVDHAMALANALCQHAPQISTSPHAGVHAIHVAASQNGWERPVDDNDFLLLSKRTRLKVRVDANAADQLIDQLENVTLNVNGSLLHIVTGQVRKFEPSTTLIARHTFFTKTEFNDDENAFVDRISQQCIGNGFTPTKILCGRAHHIASSHGIQLTRSVLFADVPATASIMLQDNGLGDGRTFGCGLFIPHKETGAVGDAIDTSVG